MLKTIFEKTGSKDYIVKNGLLYLFRDGNYTLRIPKAMANEILLKLHGDGHLSRRRLEVLAKQEYDIPDLDKRIERTLTNCVPCNLATKKKGKKDGWLQPIEKFDSPLHTHHADHAGPIPSTKKGYLHVLVIVDAFTKFTWIYPVK